MRTFYFKLIIISFFSLCAHSQNKIVENKTFQKTLTFKEAISKQDALNFFSKQNGLDANNTFVSKKETSDNSGLSHQRNQQFYKGIKVEYGTLITHCRNGNVESINGEIYNASSLDLTPSFNAIEGLNKALLNINAIKYLWEDEQQSQIVGYQKPQGELLIYPIVKTGEVKLAYKYDIYTIEPLSRQEVYVDAHNGEILFKEQIIKHATSFNGNKITTPIPNNSNVSDFESLITGTANTKYSGVRSIETRFDTTLNMHVLNDLTRGAEIVTYNCERIPASYQNVHFKDNDNNWTSAEHANSFFDNAAQDGHWGAEMTYDFWKTIFNRDSFDDNNGILKSYVHYRQTTVSLSNAFWNGSFMTYGDGASKPFTSIDVCGHEIGHAVCTYTASLAYQNQSGAINEAYSDIWGACIEHYGRTGSLSGTPATAVWRIGEDLTTSGLRYMAAPTTLGDPDTFRGTNYIATGDDGPCTPAGGSTGNDYCGVHSNSGVMNHWFYILTVGKSGTNNAPIAERDTYNVSGIGMVKSSQIAYYAERDYLTPNATFFDTRDATIAVAKSLFCLSGPEVIAVTNSWFAVNIGPSFVSTLNDVSLRDIPANNTLNCVVTSVSPTIYFDNLGTNPITAVTINYNIDGGANTTYNWTGNLPTCSTGNYQITVNTTGLSFGAHILNFTTSIPGDVNALNNSKSTYIFVNQSSNVNLINTFEAPSDNLISVDEPFSITPLWQRGASNKSILTNAVAGNSNVYATNLNGNYLNSKKSYLVSRCYNLSLETNPILKFYMAFDTEYAADIIYLQYSTNGGLAWNLLGTQSDPNWYNSNSACPNCVGGEWTGIADNPSANGSTNGTKQLYSYSLNAFGAGSASPQSNMLFRFVFHSDGVENTFDGAIIDNFVIETALGTNQSSLNDLVIYPNPTSNIINISFNSIVNDDVQISLYDVQGRLIKTVKAESTIGSFDYPLDLLTVPTGFYLLKISQGNLNYNTKIIKN